MKHSTAPGKTSEAELEVAHKSVVYFVRFGVTNPFPEQTKMLSISIMNYEGEVIAKK